MNLLQMSFSGAILIAIIILMRAVFINKLPKRTFLILWGIALIRLLIPFSIPSVLSAYSLMNRSTLVREIINDTPISDWIPTTSMVSTVPAVQTEQLFADSDTAYTQMQMPQDSTAETQMQMPQGSTAQTQMQQGSTAQTQMPQGSTAQTQMQQGSTAEAQTQMPQDSTAETQMQMPQGGTTQVQSSIAQTQIPQGRTTVSVWIIIWCIGTILCAAFFIISYLHWRFEFKTSLPVSNDFITQWLSEHKLKRTITIRQSDRIATPLTYGIFHPVILMPPKTDWENERQLQYILLHEYVHICRFDIVTKLISALALCVHWFNPMVYIMYILFNRDIELACDECVVRKSGEDSKSAYALTLIGMEEKKSGFAPIYNNFSKNAIEERITAIMKIKKTSFATIIVAVALVASVTTAFATSAAADDKSETAMPASDFSDDNQKTALPIAGFSDNNQKNAMPAADFSDEEYEKLLALQFDGYEYMSVSEYQNKVWEMTDTVEYRDLLNRLSKDEKLYEMKDSNDTAAFLFYVLEPLTAERWQKRDFSGYAVSSYKGASDNAALENAILEYIITLEILDADRLTVHEYNAARKAAVLDLDILIKSMSTSDLRDAEFMQEIIDEEINNIAQMWEISGLKVTIEYVFMPLSGELAAEDMEEWEKESKEELEQMLSSYIPFGLTYQYDSATDEYKMYFQGKEVRGLYDERENLWITYHTGIGRGIYDKDAIELHAVYENNKLTGLREATPEEQEEWTKIRQSITDEWENARESKTNTQESRGNAQKNEEYEQETRGNAQKTEEYAQESRENAQNIKEYAKESREYAYATEEDYRSLLALKTPDYEDMPVADFNRSLLDWGNEEDDDSWERIQTDMAWNDFQVSLDNEELSFVKLTVYLSMTENAEYVRSKFTGRAEEETSYNQYLPQKTIERSGRAAWCSLWYQFSYSIADKSAITVGERDYCVGSMISDIEKFWNETDIEKMLKMTEEDVVKKLQRIAEKYSSSKIVITIDDDNVQFESMDERGIY